MSTLLLTTEITSEPDVVLARQRAREVAGLLGFDHHDQTRIATAVSEIARNAFQYGGNASVRFSVIDQPYACLRIEVLDRGPGIANLNAVLDGACPGLGINSARKLLDGFQIASNSSGTRVVMDKRFDAHDSMTKTIRADLRAIEHELLKRRTQSAFDEVRAQNQELARALEDLRKNQSELELLNRELEETNRGVIVLYNELEDKAEALRRAQESKDKFFSEMNHEVRTPINAILNLSELLLNGKRLDETDSIKSLGFIRGAAQQLSELVDDLLDLAKTEAGKMVVRPEPFSVEELFAGLRGMFRPIHTRDEVVLTFEDATQLPELNTDQGKVSQILRNFISNALKFTEQGSVHVSAVQDGDHFVFCVRDTGIGIDPSQHGALFEPFVQLEHPRQKKVKGTGLGLSLTRSLCELLGGQLTLESEPGNGAAFSAHIPQTYSRPNARSTAPNGMTESGPRSQPPAPARDGERPKLLIVDDDEAARLTLRHALAGCVATILEARDGHEGLAVARAERPRLIFLDLRMPNLDGFEVLSALAADPDTRDLRVVIQTSQRLSPEEAAVLATRAVLVLDKSALQTPEGRASLNHVLRSVGVYAPDGGQP